MIASCDLLLSSRMAKPTNAPTQLASSFKARSNAALEKKRLSLYIDESFQIKISCSLQTFKITFLRKWWILTFYDLNSTNYSILKFTLQFFKHHNLIMLFSEKLPSLFWFPKLYKTMPHSEPHRSWAIRISSHGFLVICQCSSVVFLVEGYACFTQ